MKKYLYTVDNCKRCVELKKKFAEEGVEYEERSAERIKRPEDFVDSEALVQASLQNMTLPVVVDI